LRFVSSRVRSVSRFNFNFRVAPSGIFFIEDLLRVEQAMCACRTWLYSSRYLKEIKRDRIDRNWVKRL
jgi:hypothetical protein